MEFSCIYLKNIRTGYAILQMKEKSTKELYVNYYMTENASSISCLKQNYANNFSK